MLTLERPIVPTELEDQVDARVLTVHEQFSTYSLDDVRRLMPEPEVVAAGDRDARIVTLRPAAGYVNENYSLALTLPYQQIWKPSMWIRAELMRRIIAPQSLMYVLPNNGLGKDNQYCHYTPEELARMEAGDPRPMYELKTRILEAKARGYVGISGYSEGGLTSIGIASVGSPKFEITAVNADEAPNQRRSDKQLKKAFTNSGGWAEQRAAIKDAELPCLDQALNAGRLALDYARFGLGYLQPPNKAIMHAMAQGGFAELVMTGLEQYPRMKVKLGHVAGSCLYRPEELLTVIDSRVTEKEYSGRGAHSHPTGDNPYAHALMAADGLGRTF